MLQDVINLADTRLRDYPNNGRVQELRAAIQRAHALLNGRPNVDD